MDGPAHENSDSDSGDSWTLLDNSTSSVLDDQVIVDAPDDHEKDEDTDGISIISDSDPETPTFSNLSSSNSVFEEDHPAKAHTTFEIPAIDTASPNIQNPSKGEKMNVDDFHGDNNGKHKIYVHRRNKKISTVLNIIMLGSIITAAGVAFGHLWGARNECSPNTIPSVNKILSNLYKLQEENAYLRSKLKELTTLHSLGNLQKHPLKQNKCRKVFEEPLQNTNGKHTTKCVDDKIRNLKINNNFDDPAFEKEFIDDIGKLKKVYIQNKSLLDNEINHVVIQERDLLKRSNDYIKDSTINNKIYQRAKRESDYLKNVESAMKHSKLNNHKKISEDNKAPDIKPNNNHLINYGKPSEGINIIEVNNMKGRKVSYADSLKTKVENKVMEKENIKVNENRAKHKKPKDNETNFDKSISDEDLKKDNRYVGQKYKRDRQKHDRQKSHKKQKRRNKYEQWEMKGGLMRDYDELSVLSSNENNLTPNTFDKNFNSENKDNKVFVESKSNKSTKRDTEKPAKAYTNVLISAKTNKVGKKINWYEERAIIRNEARKRLEQELFGETSPNTAGWYFRRMQKREQCRAKADNTTFRKFAKQNMNFKMKH